jgi:integrase
VRQRHDRINGPYDRHGKWRIVISYAVGGSETLSFDSEDEAIRRRDALRAAVAKAQEDRPVSAAVAAYLAHRQEEGFASGTVDTDRHRLRGLLRVAEHDRPLRSITAQVARQLYARRRKEVAVDTHRGELDVAGRFATWCVAQGWLTRDPFAEVEPTGRKRAGRGKPQLRVDEARTLHTFLLARCAERIAPEPVAVLAALLLGPRAHEVVGRDVRDLDDAGRLLWISDSKSDSGRRALEVPDALRPLLRALARGRRGDAPLFMATDAPTAKRKRGTRRATRHWLYYHCEKLCAAAGVPTAITPHGLRRSHSSIAREAGATGHLVAAQLGHGSEAVQRRSYVAAGAAETGVARTVLKAIQGGKR